MDSSSKCQDHQETRTLEFFARLSLDEIASVLSVAYEHLNAPPEIVDRLATNHVLMRVVAYAFHPLSHEPETWKPLRAYITLEDQEQLELTSADLSDPEARRWLRALDSSLYAIWNAQDAQLAGDNRPFNDIASEFASHRVLSEQGRSLEEWVPYPGGGSVARMATIHEDGTGEIEYVLDDLPPEVVDVATFERFVDDLAIHCLQLWREKQTIRDDYFTAHRGKRLTVRLQRAGIVIAERPLHIGETYAPLIGAMAKQHTFANSPEDQKQEARLAFFAALIEYDPSKGFIPGYLKARTDRALSDRYKSSEVSTQVEGKRVVRAGAEIPWEEDSFKEEALPDTDEALARAIMDTRAARLTRDQREVVELFLGGLSQAKIAERRGVTAAAVSQMLKAARASLTRSSDESD